MQSIGFVGAGLMGSGICRNLLKAGHPLTVMAHRNRKPIEELVGLGAREARSAVELAKGADVLMLRVDRAETMETVVRTAMPSLRTGALVIDVTTGRPDVTRGVAGELAAKGITYVDAPVVGAPTHAAEGKLSAFVGADAAVFERVRPILMTYCVDAVLFGPTGAGITAKLLNNFVTQSTVQVVTQAYRAARRNGVDWEKLYRMMLQGAARSGTLERLIGNGLKGNFKAHQFAVVNAAKDVEYAGALLAADPDGARIQAAVHGALMRAVEAGFGDSFVSELLDPAVEAKVKAARPG